MAVTRSRGSRAGSGGPIFPDTLFAKQKHEGVSPTAKNLAIVYVELPALEINMHFSVDLSDSAKQQQALLDNMVEALQEVLEGDWNEQDEVFDMSSTKEKLASLRSEGLEELERWRKKLRAADDAVARVEGARSQMNSMRDAYFKELQQLKEQLHQKEKADEAGIEFRPDVFTAFDATEFSFDPEYLNIAKEKFDRMERDWFEKHRISEDNARSLKDKLEVAKMLAERREQLLEKVSANHGYGSVAEMLQSSGSCASRTPVTPKPEKNDGLLSKAGQSLGRAKESALNRFRAKPTVTNSQEVAAVASQAAASSGYPPSGDSPGRDSNRQQPSQKGLYHQSSFATKVVFRAPSATNLTFDAPIPEPAKPVMNQSAPNGRRISAFQAFTGKASMSTASLDSADSPMVVTQVVHRTSAPSQTVQPRSQSRYGTWSASFHSKLNKTLGSFLPGRDQRQDYQRSKSRDLNADVDAAKTAAPDGFKLNSARSSATLKVYEHREAQSDLGGWMVEEAIRLWHNRQGLVESRCDIGIQVQPLYASVGVQCVVSLTDAEHLLQKTADLLQKTDHSQLEMPQKKDQSQPTEAKRNTTSDFSGVLDVLSRHGVPTRSVPEEPTLSPPSSPLSKRYSSTPSKSPSNAPRRQSLVKGSASKMGSSMSIRGGTKDFLGVDPAGTKTSSLDSLSDDFLRSVSSIASYQSEDNETTPVVKTLSNGAGLSMSSASAKSLVKPEGPRTQRKSLVTPR